MRKTYQMVYPDYFDERVEFEAEQRGFLDYVKVVSSDGDEYEVEFCTPDRMAGNFHNLIKTGDVCLFCYNTILVPRVVREDMEKAFARLSRTTAYFDLITPKKRAS